MSHRPFKTSSVAGALFLAVLLGGCSSWHTGSVAPAQLFAKQPPDSVRVTRLDGYFAVIHDPRVIGDSVTGVGFSQEQRIGVALSDIREIAVWRTDQVKTLGLLLAICFPAIVISWLA